MPALSKEKLRQIAKLKQKKYRDLSGQYMVSGLNSVKTCLQAPELKAIHLLVEKEQANLPDTFGLPANLPKYDLTTKEFQQVTDEKNPQGVALIVEKPIPGKFSANKEEPLLLYLDRINDPGNLGTIIRTACWFGLRTILLSPESADPYQPKVVRASTGLVSHMRIVEDVHIADLKDIKTNQQCQLAGTVIHGGLNPAETIINKIDRQILLLGSEAHGLDPKLVKLCDKLYTIPKPGFGESLNLAISAGILLYQWLGSGKH